jgi:hypothetical protein
MKSCDPKQWLLFDRVVENLHHRTSDASKCMNRLHALYSIRTRLI